MKLLTIISSLLIFFTLSSCNNSGETVYTDGAKISPEVDAILLKSAEIKKAISDKNLLKYATERDKKGFEQGLRLIEVALLKLDQKKKDRGALQVLYRGIKQLERVQLTKMDDAVLEPFITIVHEYLEQVARIQNTSFQDINWAIFSHNFSDGLSPFATIGTNKEWSTGWSRDRGYATAGGYGNRADLVSPSFDLTGIRAPAFRIRHSISINQNTGSSDEFDRSFLLKNLFKAYVSTDYIIGDPDNATWTEVSLAPMPKGADFHTITSPTIDLTPFVGENVTIRLSFDMRNTKLYGRHYVSWYVEEFELLGSGDSIPITERAKDLYQFLFNKEDFAPYKKLSLVQNGPGWTPFGFEGEGISYAKIQNYNQVADGWVLSPKINLTEIQYPTLKVSEKVLNPNWNSFTIMFSPDYNGGDPNLSTWFVIERTPTVTITANKWSSEFTTSFDLSEYVGSSIVVACRYQATAVENSGWELASVKVMGMGKDLTTTDYVMSYNPFPNADITPTPEPILDQNIIFSHSFSDNGLSGFTQLALEGTPAEWSQITFNNKSYLRISGFSGKKVGSNLLYSTTIDLRNKSDAKLSLTQALNYYPAAAQALNLIRLVVAEASDNFDPQTANWQDLSVTPALLGNSFNSSTSDWLVIPETLQNKKVVVGFIYKTTAEYFPNWDLYKLELKATNSGAF